MRTIRFLLQKEFRQIFRDKTLLRQLLMAPLIQLLVFPWAATYEVRNISLAVVDHDHSAYSRRLVDKVISSGYFRLYEHSSSFDQAFHLLEEDQADIIIDIPAGFERRLVRENEQRLFLAVNAVNGVKALVGSGYLASIIQDYNQSLRLEWFESGRV